MCNWWQSCFLSPEFQGVLPDVWEYGETGSRHMIEDVTMASSWYHANIIPYQFDYLSCHERDGR